jgi:glycosyltransferase involved in cell wall biosynthesis
MKIAFLSYYSGEINRGVETFVHNLANELVGLGNEILVYQNDNALPDSTYQVISLKLATDYSMKSDKLPYIQYYSRQVKKFTGLALSQLPSDVDIVFPTNGQWQSILCKVWTAKNHKKLIISGQSGPGLDDRLNLFTFPDAFVALSTYQQKWAKVANPFVSIKKIPNGVNLYDFKPLKISKDLLLERPIIMAAAALVPWKRLDLAIKAVAGLDKGSLLIVGKGELQAELEQLGNQLLPNRFKILNFPHNKMPEIYQSADLLTFPTVPWESFGIVLIEGMASGLPVVATDDPIRREIVGPAGIFVDPQNTTAYTKALSDALHTEWGTIPVKQAQHYSWDQIALQYNKLFKQL